MSDKSLRSWLETLAMMLTLHQGDQIKGSPSLLIRRRQDPNPSRAEFEMRTVSLRRAGANSDWSCTFEGRRGKKRDIELMRQSLMAIYLDTIGRGGFPCHAGLLDCDGRGILVAGGTRTGKSTTCRRLASACRVLCDEETLIVRDGLGRYWGHPFPTWSRLYENTESQTWAVQSAVPLDGIFFIFPAVRNRCVEVGLGEAAARLTRVALDKALPGWRNLNDKIVVDLKKQIFANVCALVFKVPAARLNISLDGNIEEAFRSACQSLWKKEHPPDLNLTIHPSTGHWESPDVLETAS